MPRIISYETANKIAAVWDRCNSKKEACHLAGVTTNDPANLRRYIRATEDMLGIKLKPHSTNPYQPPTAERYDLDHEYTIADFSDAHFWPNETSPAFYIFLQIIEELQPEVIINNGDSFDGASISRHPALGWEEPPTLREELDANREHLSMIIDYSKDADHYWVEGNHDKRFAMFLAKNAPQFRDMPGTSLNVLFPDWVICDSIFFNDTMQVKHRWHGGVHTAYNNVLKAGKSIATGHTHRLTVREWTDLNGTRYGIECGTLANIYGPQFKYTEENPVNWQNGFVIITIDKYGVHPELVQVIDNRARFRGKVYTG